MLSIWRVEIRTIYLKVKKNVYFAVICVCLQRLNLCSSDEEKVISRFVTKYLNILYIFTKLKIAETEQQVVLGWTVLALACETGSTISVSYFKSVQCHLYSPVWLRSWFAFCLSYLSRSLADHWGTTVDFTTSLLHSSRFSDFHSMIFHSRPVHSLMLSSHRFLWLPLHLPPWTVPCRIVLACPDDRVTCPYTIIWTGQDYPTFCFLLLKKDPPSAHFHHTIEIATITTTTTTMTDCENL